jgi:tetratricopeptide (TPR) repeat protein
MSGDRLRMDAARARAERALFGTAEPARVGRYEIVDRIGGGGMGLVYAANDPDLDRKVALKVLHPRRAGDDRSRRRLIQEARALAKLDHPNLVKVHDILDLDGHSVVVMELVEGQTLAAWQAEAPRGWREVLAIYVQAIAGLAAAHGIHVIHRDFKPSNAMVGPDGRVRVLDFGLARLAETEDEARPAAPVAPPADLTLTGDVMGTLGYSSPEQLRGDEVTAASDQFSVCVALHQAIEGTSPFTGDTARERLDSIAAGPRPISDGRAPAWLRAAIARGLSADPSARYPSMADLLADLVKPRGWRRWRIPAGVAAIAGASVAVTLALGGGDAAVADACDGGDDRITAVWDPAARRAVLDAIGAVASPYAEESRERVAAGLDGYAQDWRDGHLAACRDHRRGSTSDALLDKRMTCLDQRLGDLRAAVEILRATDAASVANSVDVVARLPPVSRCADFERLAATIEPPATAPARAEVAAVRADVSAAEAMSRAGRSKEARAAAAAALERAAASGYAPVEVEAALAHSRILMTQRDLHGAREPLRRARTLALSLGMTADAVEASARLIYVDGMISADLAALERELEYVQPISAARQCDHFARPLLLNNVGAVYLAAGRRAEAFDYFTRARRDLGSYAPADLELSVIDRNLAMLTADARARTALAAGVWDRLRAALGDAHPHALDALWAYASYVPDAAEAYRLTDQAAEAYLRYHPTLHRYVAVTTTARAFLAAELGDRERARADYATAIATSAGSDDPEIAALHQLALGEAALLDDDPAAAIAAFEPVSRERLTSPRWYERADALRAEVGLGLAELSRGRRAAARVHLERAIAGYPEIIAMNEEVVYRRLLERAQRALTTASHTRYADRPERSP